MKKLFIYLTAVSLLFSACSKEEKNDPNDFTRGAKEKMNSLGKCELNKKIVCYMDYSDFMGLMGDATANGSPGWRIYYVITFSNETTSTGFVYYNFYTPALSYMYSLMVQTSGNFIAEKDDNNYWFKLDANVLAPEEEITVSTYQETYYVFSAFCTMVE